MLREKILSKKRAGRVLPAAIAAVVAAFGLGSCAALEMLDSLAAEGDASAHTQSAAEAPAPEADSAASAAAPTDESTAPADSSAETQPGEAQGDTSPAAASASSKSPAGELLGQIESIIDSEPAVTTSAPDVQPVTTITEQQPAADSSLYTDLAGDGTGSAADLLTPGGFSADSSESKQFTPAGGSPIYTSYVELVDKYAAYTAKDPEYKPEFCRYYITDIDDNGSPELLIETGTIETDRTIYVYSFNGSEAEQLGNFVAWHTKLGDGDGVIYNETSAMGSYIVSTIKIQDGKLFTERETQPFSETQIKMPLIGYSYADKSALESLR